MNDEHSTKLLKTTHSVFNDRSVAESSREGEQKEKVKKKHVEELIQFLESWRK